MNTRHEPACAPPVESYQRPATLDPEARSRANPRPALTKRGWGTRQKPQNRSEDRPLHVRESNMEEAEHHRHRARYVVPLWGQLRIWVVLSRAKRTFSKGILLTRLRTLAPATPFFSHTSLRHPGVVWAPSNPCALCNLLTSSLAASAPSPYRWAIALRFSWCHNRVSGQLLVRRVLCARRFVEGSHPGQETFFRSVVSNKLSGRGLEMVLPIRSAKRPVAGKRFLGRPGWRKPAWASSPASAACWGTS